MPHYFQVEAPLLKQTPGTMRACAAPKATALQLLNSRLAYAPTAFSLAFSSVSSIAGELC